MEHFELVEKLVSTFGVSYEEAKNALEKSGWDPVNAAVILERAKNGMPEPETEKTEPAREPKGSFNSTHSTIKEEGTKLFKNIWDFISLNEFVVKKSSGEVFLNLPLWIAFLLVCAFFWPVVIILALVFLMGYRFGFTGPQMGKKSVNDTVDHVEKVSEDFVEKVKNACTQEPVRTEEPEIRVDEPVVNTEAEEKAEEQPETNEHSDPVE